MPEKSGVGTSKNLLEFRASIIPYDTREDPNAPILASSGDNINLIFNIPKESFRNLAVAVIAHLDSNSDSERAGTSTGSDESNNSKYRSTETSKFRLSDLVYNLARGDTEDVIGTYEEDGNESESLKNKDEISTNQKLYENGTSNKSLGVDGKSVADGETEKRTLIAETDNFQKSSNDFQTACAVSVKNTDASKKMSNLESTCDLLIEEKCNEEKQSDAVDTVNGNSLKYKIEASNKETASESNKDYHKEEDDPEEHAAEKELNDCGSGKEEDRDILSNDSLDLSDCPELENAWPVIHPFTETEKITFQEMESLLLNGFVVRYLKLEVSSEFIMIKITSESNVQIDAVKYKETGKESTLESEGKSDDSNADNEHKECETESDSSENKSEDETLELGSPNKFPENSKFGENLQMEEKLEELGSNIPGSSPTERLKFALQEGLKISSSEVDAEKTADSVANIFQTSSENSDAKERASESDIFQTKEKIREGSFHECVTESSEIKDSNEIAVEYDNETGESNTVRESLNIGSKRDSILSEKRSHYNSPNKDESVNVSKDSAQAGKLSLNDLGDENPLCSLEANGIKESFSKPTEENDSLEDSALGKDLHLSENEVLTECIKMEDIELKVESSQERSGSIPSEIEDEIMETNDKISDNAIDDSCTSKKDNDVKNELCDQTVEDNCKAEIVTESEKSEKIETSFAKNVAEEQDASKNTSTDKSSAETKNSRIKRESNEELKDDKLKSENLGTDTNIEVSETNIESSDPESSETYSKSLEQDSLKPNSEYLEDSVSEITDIEEKLPENSFASDLDSFMDTTVDANLESASECGDLESDDVKSVVSESDDSKDSDKQFSTRRNGFKKNGEADEVDCAPTRMRRKKIPGLSKDAIPENTELKSTKSSRYTSKLDVSSFSGRTSPIGRSLRSKSVDPPPQPSKGNLYDKKHSSIVESEESVRRTRAKTPDIIAKKDLKTTARASPRKLARSSAVAEPSSASKVQSTKTTVADPKARANLDFSVSKKRSKRGSKD